VNVADNLGNTALMDALIFGDEDIINLLVKSGANVNAQDAQKQPLLERAKKSNGENIVKLLEAAGAKGAEPPPPPEPTAEELAAKKAEEEAAAAAEKPKKKR
jgi:ankyrin repeat protein